MPMTEAVLSAVSASAVSASVQSAIRAFWDVWGIPVQVVLIIVGAIVVRLIAKAVINTFVERIVRGAKKRNNVDDTQALLASPVTAARLVQRTRTLGSVLNNIVAFVIVLIAVLWVITTIDANITGAFSLITAAVGAGLGFGAQALVKDVLAGLFMVADDQLGVGDIVTTDLASGVVEDVGIRVTQVRDVHGVLWYIRNGELTRIGNVSQGWSRAIVDITVPASADVDLVQVRMLEIANALAAAPDWRPLVVEAPELWGIESVTADGVVLRIVMKTRTNARDDVAWALRAQLRAALDALGVTGALIANADPPKYEQIGPMRTRPAGSSRRRRPPAQRQQRDSPPETP